MARINLGKVVPEKGIDYFTDAEVEEIKNEIKVEIDAQGMARDIELLKTDSGHSVELTLDPQTYQIVLVLKNAAGTALSTQTIDLPNENAITNIEYNNGSLTVTKQSGATSQINLTGLIEGLVTENDFNTFKEALQTTLEAINEKDAEQDEAIAENYKVINKLNEKLENQQKVINQLPQVTGQGTSITLENTIEAQFTKFDVEGNSDQESTKGYQLLNPADFNDSLTNNGITFTNNGDGSITINGTSTGTAMLQLDKIKKTLKAGKYTFSLTNGIKDKLYMIWSAPYNSTNTIGTDMLYKEVTFDSDTELAYIYIQIPSGYTFNNVVVYPMIYEGSYDSSKPWEKYTNGASPNPSYEQPIYSAGDNGSINQKIINENIFDGIMEQGAYSGSDGTTLINSPKYIRSKNYTNVVAGETYIITIKAKGTNQTNGNIFIYNIDGTLNSTINGLLNSFTIPTGGRKIRINVFNNNNIAPSDVEFAMMNIGSTSTPYVPHEEQDYSIFVQQPMRSIGDVRDKFVKKSDGWYERHYIAELGLNGTENWKKTGRQYNSFELQRIITVGDITYWKNSNVQKSNYFKVGSAGYLDLNCFSFDGVGSLIIGYLQIDNVEDFKAWLAEKYASGKPVYVDYLLAEPQDLPCTPEQIQQIENKPSTYKDFTIIQSEDETPAYLEVAGIYDLNKLITRVEVLESEV